jgi:hypothetical protein
MTSLNWRSNGRECALKSRDLINAPKSPQYCQLDGLNCFLSFSVTYNSVPAALVWCNRGTSRRHWWRVTVLFKRNVTRKWMHVNKTVKTTYLCAGRAKY